MGGQSAAQRRRLLDHALHAAAQQRFHVFPLMPGTKTPALRRWQHRATRDPDEIMRWYRRRPYNIGVDTGRSGLVVIDLDTAADAAPPPQWPGARHGADVLARLAQTAGHDLPDTYTVATPSGGRHLYYRAPAGQALRNSAGTVGWRIDTRAVGGYVVAAGSLRPEGTYDVLADHTIPVLPDWLAEQLTTAPHPPTAEHQPGGPIGSSTAYVRAAVLSECRAVAEALPGARHHTLLRAARVLGEFVGAGALDLTDARVALHHAAARHIGVHGCTAREIEQTITDGLAYGQQRPRQLIPRQR